MKTIFNTSNWFPMRWHMDGVSVDGLFSLRISNISTNLRWMGETLNLLGKNPTVAIWSSVAFLFNQSVRVTGCEELLGNYSTQYLDRLMGEGSLSVSYSDQWNRLPSFDPLSCNLTFGNLLPGLYQDLACLCPTNFSLQDIVYQGYQLILSGQNITISELTCMENLLTVNCDSPSSEEDSTVMNDLVLGALYSGTGAFYVYFLYVCYRDLADTLRSQSAQNPRPHLELVERKVSIPSFGISSRDIGYSLLIDDEKDKTNDEFKTKEAKPGFFSSAGYFQVCLPRMRIDLSRYRPRCPQVDMSWLCWPHLSRGDLLRGISIGLAVLGAYGTGTIKGSQCWEGLTLLGTPEDFFHPVIGLLALPLIHLISLSPLYHAQTHSLLTGIKSWKDLGRKIGKRLQKDPVSALLSILAGATEGLMVANCVLKSLDESADGWQALILTLSVASALEHWLLCSQELSARLHQKFSYTSKAYRDYLEAFGHSWKGQAKAALTRWGVRLIPKVGALVASVLSFVEMRELVAQLTPSETEGYPEEMGNILGLPLSVVYGGMFYSLHAYSIEQGVVERWILPKGASESGHDLRAKINHWLVIGGSLMEALVMFASFVAFCEVFRSDEGSPSWTGKHAAPVLLALPLAILGPLGFFQHGWLMSHAKPGADDSKKVHRSSQYRVLPGFLSALFRIMTLSAVRVAIQKWLLSRSVEADEVDGRTTMLAYGLTSFASVLAWVICEFFQWRHPVVRTRIQRMGEEKQEVKLEDSSLQLTLLSDLKDKKGRGHSEHRRQSMVSVVSTGSHDSEDSLIALRGVTLEAGNAYEAKRYLSMQKEHRFRTDKARLFIQGGMQLLIPVVGALLELEIRQRLTDRGHLDSDKALDNAQVIGSLMVGLITVVVSYIIDRSWGWRERRLIERIKQHDKDQEKKHQHQPHQQQDEKSDQKEGREQKQEWPHWMTGVNDSELKKVESKSEPRAWLSMARDEEGYDEDTFWEMLQQLDLQARTSEGSIEILGLLNLTEIFGESKDEEDFQVTLKSLAEDKLKNNQNHLDALEKRFEKLKEGKSIILPYYYQKKGSFSRGHLPREDYGFLYITREEKEEPIEGVPITITISGYNPSNNPHVSAGLHHYLSQLPAEIHIDWRWLAPSPLIRSEDSGPWVLMQIEAELRKKIDLSIRPHRIDRTADLGPVRLSQFSSLLNPRNRRSDSLEARLVGCCSFRN